MAATEMPGGLWMPTPLFTDGSIPAFTSLGTITGTGASDYVAWVLQAPKTGTLDTVGFRLATVATPQNLRVSFRDLNVGTGLPDATDDQFRDIASGSLVANGWNTTASLTDTGAGGGTKRSVTAGDYFVVVLKWATTSGSAVVNVVGTNEEWAFPYSVAAAALFYQRANTIAITYDDGSYAACEGLVYPWMDFSTINVDTSSTPDEVGNLFVPPIGMQVDGAWAKTSVFTDYRLTLYDSDGTSVLAQTGLAGPRSIGGGYHKAYPFTAPVTLDAGQTYRIVLSPNSTNAVGLYAFDVPVAGAMGATELGTAMYSTSRTNAGAWTDLATRRYFLGLRLSGIDAGSSSSGGGSFAFIG